MKFSYLMDLMNSGIENVLSMSGIRKVYLYSDGKKTSTCIGHSFSGIEKELGSVSFFVPIEEISENSLELSGIENNLSFGEKIDFEKMGLKIDDISITSFNGKIYIKFILKKNGKFPKGVIEGDDIGGFFDRD